MIPIGNKCTVHGLKSEKGKHLNQQKVTIVSWIEEKGRYECLFEDGTTKHIKECNLLHEGMTSSSGSTANDEDENLCLICMDLPVYDTNGCAFMVAPCGHIFACDTCLKDLHRRRANCSICRGEIQSVQKIYPTVKPPSSKGFKSPSERLVDSSSDMGLTVSREQARAALNQNSEDIAKAGRALLMASLGQVMPVALAASSALPAVELVEPPQQPTSLYVGDLSTKCTEAKLFEVFNAIGPVSSIRICRDSITRRSLGYAYVNFNSYTDAERALDTMNYMPIMGKPCRIMWSQRNPAMRKSGAGNVFVKNLAKDIDHQALFDIFSLFGNILSCKVALDRATGESRGYGFVQFETAEAAEDAIKKVNGMTIKNQVVFVGRFYKREALGSANNWTNVFVKNLPIEMGENELRKMFEEYGEIKSMKLCYNEENEEKISKGFGFINFATHEEAAAAVEGKDQFKCGIYTEGEQKDEDRLIFVGPAMKKAVREKVIHDKFVKLKRERMQQYQGLNLYIKNLDESVDDERLRAEFDQFGNITSARIMRDDAGKSRGFGFICFSQAEEATKAITDMAGKMLAGKPIYVALAQRKDDIRQQQRKAAMARGPMEMPGMMFMPGMMGGGMGGAHPMMMQPGMMSGEMSGAHPMMMQPGMMGGGMSGAHPMMMQPGMMGGGSMPAVNSGFMPHPMMGMPNMMNPQQQQRMMMNDGRPAALTAHALASAPPAKQKNMIGERLYPLIRAQQPQRAGKITGMLLEMDNGELLNLLESPEALKAKVNEAIEVLESP